MENCFQLHMSKADIDAISNLGLAHVGDAVYELLCRSHLCLTGKHSLHGLHDGAVALVNAPAQAKFAALLLPHLTPEELSYYRRGKNAHTHAAPKAATAKEYAMATGLETLFGALYLAGSTARLGELFGIITEANHGI